MRVKLVKNKAGTVRVKVNALGKNHLFTPAEAKKANKRYKKMKGMFK